MVDVPKYAVESRGNCLIIVNRCRHFKEIKVRHYAKSTLRTYTNWVQRFQSFTQSKDTQLLSGVDVKEYLTFFGNQVYSIFFNTEPGLERFGVFL